MPIYIKNRIRKKSEFQFFMHQFVEAGIKNGFKPLSEFESNNFFVRLARKLSPLLKYFPKNKKNVIIACGGGSLYYYQDHTLGII